MKQIHKNINWDATSFFERLASMNKLAKAENFTFCRVSGLEGFEECLHNLQSTANFIAVSDIVQGYTELNTTPHTRRVKTVFFAMRHALDDMQARQECMDTMRELFRQFMSVLIQESSRRKTKQFSSYFRFPTSHTTVHAVPHTAVPILDAIRDTHPLK